MNYNKIHPYHKQYHQQFSPTVDTDGHTHIPTIQRTRIISDKRLVNCLAKIIVRTAKTAVQDSGQCRFRITGIGTGMHPPVMCHELQQRPATGNQHYQQGSQSGGKVIGHVVHTGRPAAKIFITGIAVANHRVEGIAHLIRQHPRHPQQKIPEKRSDDTVTQILGQSLKGSRTHLPVSQGRSISSHDAGHLFSPGFQRSIRRFKHHPNLIYQGFPGQTIEYGHYRKCYLYPRMQQSCRFQQPLAHQKG